MTAQELATKLDWYIRPETFPLALRVLSSGGPLPPKVRLPVRDLGRRMAVCQVIGISRRYGWVMAVREEDLCCPIALIAFGHRDAPPYYGEGNLAKGMYTSSLEAGARSEGVVPKLGPGDGGTLLVAPLAKAEFEPEVILVYCNPAQAFRLVAASLWHSGGALESVITPRADCAEVCIRPLSTGKPQFILPCYGDRVFGLTQDHEVAFAFPFAFTEQLLEGLNGTQQGGIRYPIPAYARFTPEFPASYERLFEIWGDGAPS